MTKSLEEWLNCFTTITTGHLRQNMKTLTNERAWFNHSTPLSLREVIGRTWRQAQAESQAEIERLKEEVNVLCKQNAIITDAKNDLLRVKEKGQKENAGLRERLARAEIERLENKIKEIKKTASNAEGMDRYVIIEQAR